MGSLEPRGSRPGMIPSHNFRYNKGPEELLQTLIERIIEDSSEVNPETGEMEFTPQKLETESFVLRDKDKSSIWNEEKLKKHIQER